MQESSFGRLVGVLVSPAKTFKSLSEKPTWLVALLVLMVLGLLVSVMRTGKIDWAEMTRESIEARGQELSEDQLEGIIDMQEKFGPAMMIGVSVLGTPIIFVLLAAVFMVVFKMLGGEIDFGRSLSVFTHSLMPRAVMALLSIPVVLGKDEFGFEELRDGSLLASNLGFLAPQDAGPALSALFASFDLFSLWALFLLVIGYSVVAKVSKGAAAGGVIGLWVVYVLGKMGLAALGS